MKGAGLKVKPRGFFQWAILALSSVGGLGYLPWAPGTWGTAGGLLIWWAMGTLAWPVFLAITVILTLGAIWVSGRAEKIYGHHDVGHIVIDEVAGILVTAVGVPWRFNEVVVAFILFRILDATKPPPIRWFDKHVGGGFGVVIDDVVAGVVACGIMHSARILLGGWW